MSCKALAITAAALAAAAPAVHADEVIDWNNVMLDLVRETSTNPARASRIFAMTQLAVFDAVNEIEGGYEAYLDIPGQAPPNADARAAAVAAAYEVLVDQYPGFEDMLDEAYDASMAAIPDGPAKNKGRAWGRKCAKFMLRERRNDGAEALVVYAPSGEFGYWQPTPPAFAPALLPQWGFVEPFGMLSGEQFRAPEPPPFDSREYTMAYNEVRRLGDVDSRFRTPDQTLIAYFWEDGAGTVTPPGHWLVIAQQMSEMHGYDLAQNARLFALISMVQADAAICAWDSKFWWDHLRPYTAITSEAADDGNDRTPMEPDWFNLIPTPPFPAYTSGHSTFSGGSSKLLELFIGTDEISFSGESPDPDRWPDVLPGVVRSWTSLSQAAEEAGQSRIYGGIHWQYDNQEGLNGGRGLAEFAFDNYLRPVN